MRLVLTLLRAALLSANVVVIFVLAVAAGVGFGSGSGRGVLLGLGSVGLAVVLAGVVTPTISRWLRTGRPRQNEQLEDPPVLLALFTGLMGLGGLMGGSWFGLLWLLLSVAAAFAVCRLARRIWPLAPELTTATCSNCGYDLRGRASESCPECGYTHFALGRWLERWVLVYFPLPGETGYAAAMWGLRPDEVDLHAHGGEVDFWDESGGVLWLRRVPDDLVCFHRLKRGGQAVLPSYHPADRCFGVFPATDEMDEQDVGSVDPGQLEKEVFADVVSRNQAAVRTAGR